MFSTPSLTAHTCSCHYVHTQSCTCSCSRVCAGVSWRIPRWSISPPLRLWCWVSSPDLVPTETTRTSLLLQKNNEGKSNIRCGEYGIWPPPPCILKKLHKGECKLRTGCLYKMLKVAWIHVWWSWITAITFYEIILQTFFRTFSRQFKAAFSNYQWYTF